jgi:hypothetical protein
MGRTFSSETGYQPEKQAEGQLGPIAQEAKTKTDEVREARLKRWKERHPYLDANDTRFNKIQQELEKNGHDVMAFCHKLGKPVDWLYSRVANIAPSAMDTVVRFGTLGLVKRPFEQMLGYGEKFKQSVSTYVIRNIL